MYLKASKENWICPEPEAMAVFQEATCNSQIIDRCLFEWHCDDETFLSMLDSTDPSLNTCVIFTVSIEPNIHSSSTQLHPMKIASRALLILPHVVLLAARFVQLGRKHVWIRSNIATCLDIIVAHNFL